MDNNYTNIVVRKPEDGIHIESMGNIYRFIMTGEETEGRFSLMEALVNPGDGGPFHLHHREDESFLITKGEMVFYDGKNRIVATTGTFVMCHPRSKRAFRNESNTQVRMIIFYTPPGIEKMIEMEGKVIDPKSEIIHLVNPQKVACPQLSKEFGIDDFDSPLPNISMMDQY
ncbi:cupin domain-containing protein [Colwellia psychrerythraea]|uniref:Cupin 2 conserved barrel domain protein n=1 Tax=Colwellia psychrerythraea TaxID=28229 RepID=A0A099KQN5_COLPS|nr:cupin domain-containing protein [Colwellia psychrerythraea]KGJ92816.1 Cupin 2 conserved barrel domain protein [Colwellia psychrerythraea]